MATETEETARSYLAGRLESIRPLLKIADGEPDDLTEPEFRQIQADYGEPAEIDAWECLAEIPLSIEVFKLVRITLGTGGPADYFEAVLTKDGDFERITYHYLTWGHHDVVEINDLPRADRDAVRAFLGYFCELAV